MKNKKLLWLYILSASIYAMQGFEGIPGTAIFAYLKETLHFSPEKIMYLGSIISLPWLVKPIFGVCIDQYLTKKIWVLISLIGSIIISLSFAISSVLTIPFIIVMGLLGSYFTATRDIANDGLACIEGKESNTCDIFQNVQWTAITLAGIITSLAGGYIADHFSYKTAYLCLIPIYLIIIGIVSQYRSGNAIRETPPKTQKPLATLLSYQELFTNKKFLVGCLFIFLYNFNPSFGTPLEFIKRDTFKWSWTFMGTLGAISSAISILGSIIYYKLGKRINMEKTIYYSVFIGAITTLFYLWYTPVTAIIYNCLFGIIGMFIFLNFMTFMSLSTINGKEATSFALLCSINNLAATASSLCGAYLYPKIGLQYLIILSALTSFMCLPLIRIMFKKEKE